MTLIIHAPNIHQGGGKTLLNELLVNIREESSKLILDERLLQSMVVKKSNCYGVKPALLSRLFAEFELYRTATPEDQVLCFANLPPLLPSQGKVYVFLQNRYIFGNHNFSGFGLSARFRLLLERLWFRTRTLSNYQIIVQSFSMQRELKQSLGIDSWVLPFLPHTGGNSLAPAGSTGEHQFDFVYVSSAEPHKNHGNLLVAWEILAQHGVRPSLALTVSENSAAHVAKLIEQQKQQHGLNIKNFGTLPHGEVHALYKNSGALIFPSKLESYGLPLLEAKQLGMPILAPELDYVRDVVLPDQTFNPDSPTSIARAVMRHLNVPIPTTEPVDAATFLARIQKQGEA